LHVWLVAGREGGPRKFSSALFFADLLNYSSWELPAKNLAPAVSTHSALTSDASFEMGVSKLLKRK
jgi:hypothetical protein